MAPATPACKPDKAHSGCFLRIRVSSRKHSYRSTLRRPKPERGVMLRPYPSADHRKCLDRGSRRKMGVFNPTYQIADHVDA
jgi:hypothetical protein